MAYRKLLKWGLTDIQILSNNLGKHVWGRFAHMQEHAQEVETEPSATAEGERGQPPRKRAKPGESLNGPSFARRNCPKSSPAKEKWEVIKKTFEEILAPYLVELGFSKFHFEVWFLLDSHLCGAIGREKEKVHLKHFGISSLLFL